MPATDVTSVEWDAYVAASPRASAYHAWVWRDIIEDAFGHQTRYLATRRGARVCGVLPLALLRSRVFGRAIVSLPFVNGGGIVADAADAALALTDAAEEIRRGEDAGYVELRHATRQLNQLPARAHKVSMTLALPTDAGRCWADLDHKIRNQVRKAERNGLMAETGGLDLLDPFYEVFARNMRDLGTPVYGRRFFELVLRRVASAECIVVRDGGRPVAAAITTRWRESVEAPWASSLRESRPRCANVLLYWTMIHQAIERRARIFDFGRSSPDSGPWRFKLQWGAVPSAVAWEYLLAADRPLPNLTPGNPLFAPMIAVWKRLPMPVANLLGPHIVRSIP